MIFHLQWQNHPKQQSGVELFLWIKDQNRRWSLTTIRSHVVQIDEYAAFLVASSPLVERQSWTELVDRSNTLERGFGGGRELLPWWEIRKYCAIWHCNQRVRFLWILKILWKCLVQMVNRLCGGAVFIWRIQWSDLGLCSQQDKSVFQHNVCCGYIRHSFGVFTISILLCWGMGRDRLWQSNDKFIHIQRILISCLI